MTSLEAINHIEEALAGLGLRDRWGEPVEPIVAGGIVATSIGQEWDAAVDAFENGLVPAAEYCTRILALIQRFARDRFSAQVDTRLAHLKLDQVELDLVPRGAAQ